MAFIIVSLVIFIDQFSKFLITKNLSLNQSISVIKGVFHITLIHNYGAAFGILKDRLPLFVFSAICAVILIYYNLKKNQHKKLSVYTFALSFILAGALGNLIDRVVFGYVIDFLDFGIWPVFNIADSAITVGAVLLGLSILRSKNRNL